MRTFADILKRNGFKESDLQSFGHCSDYLFETISAFGYKPNFDEKISELQWIECMEAARRKVEGWGRESIVDPDLEEVPLADIDSHIRGTVRWMNVLGLTTIFSCDGHDRHSAFVDLKVKPSKEQMKMLQSLLPKNALGYNFSRHNRLYFRYPAGQKKILLDYTEMLHDAVCNKETFKNFEIEAIRAQLIKWLSIPGKSGHEEEIRNQMEKELKKLVEFLFVDRAGNLLGEIKLGEGPTILLSAHMDVYSELVPERKIFQNGTILSSSAGILGADDRAGIATVFSILKRVSQTNFSGTIKVAFTVGEEIGCIGSKSMDQTFLRDVDAAIVFDRRGSRDIVTSHANIYRFCSREYGELFEEAGRLAGMPDWKTTPGGISDTRVFAELGIESVNLSVGFQNEHTEFETVDYLATYETIILVEHVLNHCLIKKCVKK